MKLTAKTLALIVLVLCFTALWQHTTDRDVALAQGRRPVVITRIFTGPDGLAHAEDIELTLNARGASEMFKATGVEFSVRAPTPGAKADNDRRRPERSGMAYRSGTSVRDHALRELGGRSVGGRPCGCWTRAYQPDRRHVRQGAHHEKLRSRGSHRVDDTACRWCRDRRYEEAEDSLTAVTVVEGRVMHNAMSQLPDSRVLIANQNSGAGAHPSCGRRIALPSATSGGYRCATSCSKDHRWRARR